MSRPARLHTHSAVSTALALHSDHALRELVDTARPIGAGIGGKAALLEVAGVPVFVKRVPLTDLERQPGHVGSTANLFDLPLFCQYGVNSRGLLHLDAHFGNILTDGRRLYFADYGLALSSEFDLAPEESAFFDRNQSYDRCYTVTYLVHWLITALYGLRRDDRHARSAMMHAFAAGERPEGISEAAAAVITRHAPIAASMSGFMDAFQQARRSTSYPDEEIRRMLGL
ncbi:hypothetical protein FEK35_16145 [Nocardia cyriacigeorgica]|uniref:Protein kinase domain-containing protein n=1 Tax=Nocardia cyriacigeorgica TaxID=135487 RepID=A0A5R8PD99_9NOCA|nr:hypothetical protein [Nocardia cyriacigeorgica]TLG09041.1 hypothetical protein FEK35_16145 [Nocardia cyriacigeorgica]